MSANPASEVYSCVWGLPFFGRDAYLLRTASATAAGRDEGSPPRAVDAIARNDNEGFRDVGISRLFVWVFQKRIGNTNQLRVHSVPVRIRPEAADSPNLG